MGDTKAVRVGQLWREKDRRMLAYLAEVVSVDDTFVWIKRTRTTRCRLTRFVKAFTLHTDIPESKP